MTEHYCQAPCLICGVTRVMNLVKERAMNKQQTFEWASLKVSVTAVGPKGSPMDKRKECMHYAVSVSIGSRVSYLTDAWGSIAEYERYVKGYRSERHLDFKSIGAMVVDELYSALSDPDEFMELVQGDKKGPAALEALRNAERTILAAARFGDKALSEAADKIREEGLL